MWLWCFFSLGVVYGGGRLQIAAVATQPFEEEEVTKRRSEVSSLLHLFPETDFFQLNVFTSLPKYENNNSRQEHPRK